MRYATTPVVTFGNDAIELGLAASYARPTRQHNWDFMIED